MMSDQYLFHCRRLPARLTVEQVALLLGFLPYEIPVLVRAGLLNYLGRPAPNARKYFSAVEVEQLSRDTPWLQKASRAVTKYIHEKNRSPQFPNAEPLAV